jgi:drug/metabolite transporter (DMT)-like permease
MATIIGYLVFGEEIGPRKFIGGFLIIVGVVAQIIWARSKPHNESVRMKK